MDIKQLIKKENLLYEGKSKNVYRITEGEYTGKYGFVFTDRGTGYIDTTGMTVFDPGYDNVVGEIAGKGAIACKFATHFFKFLEENKVPSHYIATVADNVMIVEPANPISMPMESPEFAGSAPLLNLEFTWRNNAMGSFWRRYPFSRPCRDLGKVVEAWTKGKSDILITYEALDAQGVMSRKEIDFVDKLVKDIAKVVTEQLAQKGLHAIDGKLELGRLKSGDGKIVLIDEISPDVLRVCKGYKPDKTGNCTVYHECIKTAIADGKRTISGKNQVDASEVEKIFLGKG